jgi:hypothetical protein
MSAPAEASEQAQPAEQTTVVAKFWKSPRRRDKAVWVTLGEFKGYPLVSVRIYETKPDGIDRPTQRGVSLLVSKLPELERAISKAVKKAEELGLLSDQGGGADER